MTLSSAPISHMRPSAIPAWRHLETAVEESRPACLGDDRFTADSSDLKPGDRDDMRAMCRTCPILAACAAYANADEPTAGFWSTIFRRKENAA